MSKQSSGSHSPGIQGLALGTVIFVMMLGAVFALKQTSNSTKDTISLKGDLWMSVIRKRGDDQLTADAELSLRPGAQIQFQLYVDELTNVSVGFMPVEGEWTPVV